MTATAEAAGDAPGGIDWPAIPAAAWRRGIGVPCPGPHVIATTL